MIYFKQLFLLLLIIPSFAFASSSCKPKVNFKKPQYIIAYGSLLNEKSKKISAADSGFNIPINLKGFKREWNYKGTDIGYSTTFLGISPSQKSVMNAALFRVFHSRDILYLDKRELNYCRIKISPKDIEMLDGSSKPRGEIWIYANLEPSPHKPNERYPIVQSYVDIFLEGCIRIGKRFEIKDYAEQCVQTTHGWSRHWVNDRLYPRRAFIYQKKIFEIDKLLHRLIPEYYRFIKIE